jgi:UDP-N-acetylmuramoyl-L-alanyl-D-glutamate--2,6-diaminopimelate ligase
MLENIRARSYSYGFEMNEDFHGVIKKSDFNGLELNFNQIEIKSKLLGEFNAYNLLSVWGVCKLLGFDLEKVKKIIEDIKPPRGRFEHFTSSNGVLVIVDYAHTPDALQKVLSTIKEIKSKESRIISVFGCGGDRDPLKRPMMGRIGVAMSDIPIFTSDNPRSEDPNKIIADMTAELYPADMKKVRLIPDRREAIKEAVKLAKKGDVILCAGKGHEDYQEIKGVKYHFNDMEEFRNFF